MIPRMMISSQNPKPNKTILLGRPRAYSVPLRDVRRPSSYFLFENTIISTWESRFVGPSGGPASGLYCALNAAKEDPTAGGAKFIIEVVPLGEVSQRV
jgi:hypothetical protein